MSFRWHSSQSVPVREKSRRNFAESSRTLGIRAETIVVLALALNKAPPPNPLSPVRAPLEDSLTRGELLQPSGSRTSPPVNNGRLVLEANPLRPRQTQRSCKAPRRETEGPVQTDHRA